jgi:endonuclease/exonuclease/phosphatase family metal-dependent hydrolase
MAFLAAITDAPPQLRPTATVVRSRTGEITVERPGLCADVEAAVAAAGAAAVAAMTQARTTRTETRSGRLFSWTGNAWAAAAAGSAKCGSDPGGDFPRGTLLRVVSYNVWFAKHEWERRCDGLIELLFGQEEADLALLQEATPRFLGRLLGDVRVRERFCISDAGDGASFHGHYGVVMLVRRTLPLPQLTFVELVSQMGRRGLIAEFGCGLDRSSDSSQTLAITTVHLESLNRAETRLEQLKLLDRVLKCQHHSLEVLAGDFNIPSSGALSNRSEHESVTQMMDEAGWQDCFVRENGEHGANAELGGGLTYDTRVNTMVRRVTGQEEDCARYDRVLARKAPDASASVQNVRVIRGQLDEALFISDHFGLAFEIWVPS